MSAKKVRDAEPKSERPVEKDANLGFRQDLSRFPLQRGTYQWGIDVPKVRR